MKPDIKNYPDFKQGFKDGYALCAVSPNVKLRGQHSHEYATGYEAGYIRAACEADDAFRAQISYERP